MHVGAAGLPDLELGPQHLRAGGVGDDEPGGVGPQQGGLQVAGQGPVADAEELTGRDQSAVTGPDRGPVDLAAAEPGRDQADLDTPGVQDGQGPVRRYMRDAAFSAANAG